MRRTHYKKYRFGHSSKKTITKDLLHSFFLLRRVEEIADSSDHLPKTKGAKKTIVGSNEKNLAWWAYDARYVALKFNQSALAALRI